MKTHQTTIDGQRRRVTIPGNDDTADAEASEDTSAERLAESLADALQSIAGMPPVAPGDAITRGDAINAYHGAVRIARDAVRFYNARRRAANPGNGEAMLDAIAAELSPQALALVVGGVASVVGVFGGTAADRQAGWFVKRLVERLGGKEACARLLEELDV